MTAREMFEELGYRCYKTGASILYINYSDDKGDRMIEFYYSNFTFDAVDKNGGPLNVNVKELEAINKQCKELGWLEEETCTNESEYNLVDGFECSNCGIIIENYNEIEIDEDYPEDRCMKEYAPRYCPNCGRKIVD